MPPALICRHISHDAGRAKAAFQFPIGPQTFLLKKKMSCMLMTSLNAPVSSLICVTRREPSLMRAICTIRWTADAIGPRGCSGRLTLPIKAIVSIRARASRGCWRERWSVSDRARCSWPAHVHALFAADLAQHNPVRTHTKSVDHQFSLLHRAFSFHVGRQALQPHYVRMLHLQSGPVFMAICAAFVDKARTRIQQSSLYRAVPPETMMFSRACTVPSGFRASAR